MFSDGEYVVYSANEICRLDGKEKRNFNGNAVEYCRLIPYNSPHSVYFIPADLLEQRVRRLLSREEVYSVIDSLSRIKEVWDDDNAKRKTVFGEYLKSGDYSKIFCVAKSEYLQRKKRLAKGKKLTAADESLMKSAEKIISQEFSVVLGISPDDVGRFISERLERVFAENSPCEDREI